MLPFKLIYTPDYYLPIGQHVFPAEKYKLVHDRLIETGAAAAEDFLTPSLASDQDVLLVHTPAYVEKLKTGTLSAREEMELEVPYSAGAGAALSGWRRGDRFWRRRGRSRMAWRSTSAAVFIMPFRTMAKAFA